MWFDQQQGGKAFFPFTGDLAAHEVEIAQLMPAGADWEVIAAEHSMAELRSLQDEITADFAELVAAGIPVTQIVASGPEHGPRRPGGGASRKPRPSCAHVTEPPPARSS